MRIQLSVKNYVAPRYTQNKGLFLRYFTERADQK